MRSYLVGTGNELERAFVYWVGAGRCRMLSAIHRETIKNVLWMMAPVLFFCGPVSAIGAQTPTAAPTTATVQSPVEIDEEEVAAHRIGEPPHIVAKIELPREGTFSGPLPIRVVVGPDGNVITAKFDAEEPDNADGGIPKQVVEKIRAAAKRAEVEARKMRYKPFERDGKPVTVTFEEEVIILPEDPALRPRADFPAIKNWNSLRMRLERTACFGMCPIYSVEVQGDGTVLYEGQGYVAVTGQHRATVDRQAVAELLEAFRKADYFSLRDQYQAMITDNPTYTTSIVFDGVSKHVVDYVGRAVGMPAAVTELENKIDEVVKTKRWIE